jgi:membrane protein
MAIATASNIGRGMGGECRKAPVFHPVSPSPNPASVHSSGSSYPAAVASFSIPERFDPLRGPLDRVRDADPLLMSAAIAYNAFFALVPLAIAAVGALSLFGGSEEEVESLQQFVTDVFPPEVTQFIFEIIEEASDIVGDGQGPVIVISLLVAIYAGSRGIYAVQKALRQIQDVEEDRPYWRVRGLGFLFTLGAGVALVAGYVILLFGQFFESLLQRYGLNVGLLSDLSAGVLVAWVILLLWAIYQWGPPTPFQRAFIASVVATGIITLMTWAAAYLIPTFGLGSDTLAVLGAVGIVLIWLYALGFVVIVVPAFISPTEAVIRGSP